MYHKHNTEGIVISGSNRGDSNRDILVFSIEFGLICVIVQNVRSLNSKLRYSVQDFSISNLTLIRGRNSWKLVGAKAEKNLFQNLKSSPLKLAVIANVFNLIKSLVGKEEENRDIFTIVKRFVLFIEEADDGAVPLAECIVLLRILHNLGYMRNDPELATCFITSDFDQTSLDVIADRKSTRLNSSH